MSRSPFTKVGMVLFLLLAVVFNWSSAFAQSSEPGPQVVSTVPSSNATGVPVSAIVIAYFHTGVPVDPLSVTAPGAFTLWEIGATRAATAVSGLVTFDSATQSATFTPSASLQQGFTYQAQVSGVKSLYHGTPMASTYLWNFSTEAAVAQGPRVISCSPADGATGVPLNTLASATFDQAMDPGTIDSGSFLGEAIAGPGASMRTMVSGTVTYDSTTNTATFTPGAALVGDTTYQFIITTAATSALGVPLASDYSWSFTAAATQQGPAVINTDPADGATGVQRDIIVVGTFDQDMDPATINSSSFILEYVGPTPLQRSRVQVSGLVEYDAAFREAKFTPAALLEYSSSYAATITTAVQSAAGLPLAATKSWSFVTETAAPVQPVTLTSPPLTPGEYQMFSVPVAPTNPEAGAVFGGDLGPANPQVWRLFYFDPYTQTNVEYKPMSASVRTPTTTAVFPDVASGLGFWLISRDGGQITGTGTLATEDPFKVTVPPGWCLVGNPYNGTVLKSALEAETTVSPSVREGVKADGTASDRAPAPLAVQLSDPTSPIENTLWEYVHNSYQAVESMKAWGAYFVYNRTQSTAVLSIPKPAPAAGSLQVTVQDAVTGNILPGATVTLNGFAATSDATGVATIPDTPTGTFTLTVSMAGYITYQQTVTLVVGPNNLIVALSPQLAAGQMRFVLTWGENPRDLDSHLTGPDTAGGRFHVYFADRNPTGADANLDVDDTSSYGPETITISQFHSGTYRYYVHHFSGTGTLSTSGAIVKVYGEQGLLATATVPTTGTGEYWYVFDVDGATRAITLVNTIGITEPASILAADKAGDKVSEEMREAQRIFRNLPHKPYGN